MASIDGSNSNRIGLHVGMQEVCPSLHKIIHISYKYMVNVRNKFDTLQETSERYTLNDEYENFITTRIEAAVECIPTKPRAKCRVLWESIADRRKEDDMKKASLLDKRNPTNANM